MTTNAVALMSQDDADLNYTQSLRRRIASELMGTEGKIPTDKDTVHSLLTTLNDMDRQVIAQKRIKVDEKTQDNTAMANAIIADVINRVGGKKIFEIEGHVRDIPLIDGPLIDDVVVVPGELLDADTETTFENFMENRR